MKVDIQLLSERYYAGIFLFFSVPRELLHFTALLRNNPEFMLYIAVNILFLKFITIVFLLLRKFFDDGPLPANASAAPAPVHAGTSESSGCSFFCYFEPSFS